MATTNGQFSLLFIVTFVTIFNVLISILKEVTRTIPTPYIDEIFHIPQAQSYCRNEFDKWDSKITTLPGLYLVSVAIIKPLEAILGLKLCSVYGLRFINVLGTLLNFALCYGINQKNNTNVEKWKSIIPLFSALNIAMFPPLFLFSFFYYTDVWSTAFVLLMYLLHLHQSRFLATVAGVCAIMMRQTNVIWVGLITLDAGWKAIALRKKDQSNSISGIIHVVSDNLSWKSLNQVLRATLPYLTLCASFLIFVVINRGIVVGDRKAHSVVMHPMQILYFLDIAAFFALPFIVFELKDILKHRPNIQTLSILCITAAVLSEYNLLEHPYLLADNRHLNFYIWRRSFGHRVYRRFLCVTYVVSGFALLRLLRKLQFPFLVWLAVCTIMNLTPQYLFEIRYFIIPFIIARLNFSPNLKSILLETAFFSILNMVVLYIFFHKTFTWNSEPFQRIIW